jgi:hypothetical protein
MWILVFKASFSIVVLSIAALGASAWMQDALPSTFTRFDRWACAWIGGFGLLSLALFLIGQWKFTLTTIIATIGLAVAGAVKPLHDVLRAIHRAWCSRGKIPKFPSTVILVVLLLTCAAGMAEITGDSGSDTVAYHLLGPKIWLREGIIRPVPDNSHTAFPQTAETLYSALFAIGGTRAPGLFSFAMFGLLLLASASVATRCGLDSTGAWWVAALVATMPAVYSGTTNCFVDGLYAAFLLVAVRIGLDAHRRREWAMFGMYCGLAISTKYPGLLALPLLVSCAIMRSAGKDGLRFGVVEKVGITVVAACSVAGGYYVRNWILLGCPIYPPPPGFAHICSPKYLSPNVVAQFHSYIYQRGGGLGRGLVAFLLLPFNLTYHTSNFHGAGGIGLCPLAFAPLGIIASRRNSFAKMVVLVGFLLTVVWFVTQQESRFLIEVYVMGAIYGVVGWRYAISSGREFSRLLAGAIVALSIAYGAFMIRRADSEGVRADFSASFATQRRNKEIPFLESFEFLNREPSVRKVLILDRFVPSYYCDKDYIKPVGQWGERTLPGGPDALEALGRARDLNISHVLDVNSEIVPFQVKEKTSGLTLIFEAKNQRVYRVN